VTSHRVIFLRIEPTSYALALLRALREIWPGEIDAQFITCSATQPWEFDAQTMGAKLLPADPGKARRAIREAILKDPRSAIIHTAGWGAPVCQAAISTAYKAKIPVVADHDTWTDAAKGLAGLAKRIILPRRLAKITHFASGGQRQAAFVRRYGVAEAKVTPANMTVDVLKIRRYLTTNPRARESFRRRFGLPKDDKVVLFLSRLVPGKGVEDLLSAWCEVAKWHKDTHLAIVGDGPLMPMVRDCGHERVHTLGRLSGDSVWEAYAAADIFVAPSHSEGWGLTINEAMAAGVPIVMTDAFGCIGDLAIADQTVCIARAGDSHDLQKCIEMVLENDQYRNLLRNSASQLISKWTIEDQAQKITEIWERVISEFPCK